MYALEDMNRTQMEVAILDNDIEIDLDVALNMTDDEILAAIRTEHLNSSIISNKIYLYFTLDILSTNTSIGI